MTVGVFDTDGVIVGEVEDDIVDVCDRVTVAVTV